MSGRAGSYLSPPPPSSSLRVTLGRRRGRGENANEWTACGCDDKGGKAKPLKQPKKEKKEEDEEDKVCFFFPSSPPRSDDRIDRANVVMVAGFQTEAEGRFVLYSAVTSGGDEGWDALMVYTAAAAEKAAAEKARKKGPLVCFLP